MSVSKCLGQSDFIFKRLCGSVCFRHWDQIRQEVQQTFDPTSTDFTLEKIVALGLDHHAEQISDISGAASKELSIEQVTYPPSELSLSPLGPFISFCHFRLEKILQWKIWQRTVYKKKEILKRKCNKEHIFSLVLPLCMVYSKWTMSFLLVVRFFRSEYWIWVFFLSKR